MHYKDILLIDDDIDDREIFVMAVSKVSATANCTAMANAKEALKKLTSHEISPDVIFLDLNMPVMNGQQFLIAIKKVESLKNIPIIIFSTSSHTPTIQLVKELGALDYIMKPENFNDLMSILSPLVANKTLN